MHGQRNTVINLADYGAKELTTTGSIGDGSTQLTVANATGFNINDHVIVGIGGEAGAGARGTVGVGGTWPSLSYATKTAMDADHSKPNGLYAYVVATGNVYQYNIDASNTWVQNTLYYTSVVIPKALKAKIIGKSGNVLTLDTAATVATTNATVYFDNHYIFDQFGTNTSGQPDYVDIILPAGMLWTSDWFFVWQHNYWRILGAGKDVTVVRFPDGIAGLAIVAAQQTKGLQVRGLTAYGNARSSGYMISVHDGDETTALYAYGIYALQSVDVSTFDTKSVDAFQGGIEFSFGINNNAYRHDAVLTQGLQTYIQWQIQGADCTGGSFVDCTVTSPTLTAGIEWFRSTNVVMKNITLTNSVVSLNSADFWTLNNINVTIAANSYVSEAAFSRNSPIITIGTNIGTPVANGGTLINVTINQPTVLSPDNDSLQGINVDVSTPNVTIDGGTITLPSYTSPSTLKGALAVNSTGANLTVSNLTVVGAIKAGSGYGNLTLNGANNRYHNITAGSIVGGAPF